VVVSTIDSEGLPAEFPEKLKHEEPTSTVTLVPVFPSFLAFPGTRSCSTPPPEIIVRVRASFLPYLANWINLFCCVLFLLQLEFFYIVHIFPISELNHE